MKVIMKFGFLIKGILVLLLLLAGLFSAGKVSADSGVYMYFSPTSVTANGNTAQVDVYVNANGNNLSSVEFRVNFPASQLQFSGSNLTNIDSNVLSSVWTHTANNSNGTFDFGGGSTPDSPISGSFKVGTITFNTTGLTSAATISFTNQQFVAFNQSGYLDPAAAHNGTILPAAAATNTPTPQPSFMTISGQVTANNTSTGLSGVTVKVIDHTQADAVRVATTASNGQYSIASFVRDGDNYAVEPPSSAPSGFLNPVVATNGTSLCNSSDTSYENQNSKIVAPASCQANSNINCASSCNFAYNAGSTPTSIPGSKVISGTVSDARTQKGLPNIIVTVSDFALPIDASGNPTTKNATTAADGSYSINGLVRDGDTYSVVTQSSLPAGYVSVSASNSQQLCNLSDTSYINQNSKGVVNPTPACQANSTPNCGTACNFAYNPPATVFTTAYKLVEGTLPTDWEAKDQSGNPLIPSVPYTANPLAVTYTFKDTTPGLKNLFVHFYYSDGSTSDGQLSILYSPNPTIDSVACSYSLTGTGTQFTINGANLGTNQGKGSVKANNETAQITSWGSSTVVATIPDRITAPAPVQVAIDDGRLTNTPSCAINQTTLSFAAKIDCLPGNYSASKVLIQIYQNAPGVTKPFYPTTPQLFSLDTNGVPQGFAPPLEANTSYVLVIKAFGTTARAIPFTTTSGTTVLPDISLPAGNIFPVNNPDSAINSLDVAELYREWSLGGGTTAAGDFNQDGAVNSLDYACIKNNTGKSDESFTAPIVAIPTPVATGSNFPTATPLPSGTSLTPTTSVSVSPTVAAGSPTATGAPAPTSGSTITPTPTP